MIQGSEAFFHSLSAREYEPLLRRVNGTCQFEIGGTGEWLVRSMLGKLYIIRTQPGTERQISTADCRFVCSEATFRALLKRSTNVVTAYVQGRVRLIGNLELGLSFGRLIHLAHMKRLPHYMAAD